MLTHQFDKTSPCDVPCKHIHNQQWASSDLQVGTSTVLQSGKVQWHHTLHSDCLGLNHNSHPHTITVHTHTCIHVPVYIYIIYIFFSFFHCLFLHSLNVNSDADWLFMLNVHKFFIQIFQSKIQYQARTAHGSRMT